MAEGQSSEQTLAEAPPAVGGLTATSDFDPAIPRPTRVVYDTPSKSGYPGTRKQFYTGPNRVNAKNQFEYINGVPQQAYDENSDSKNILYGLSDLDRRQLLNDVAIAVGGSYKPSKGGLSDSDFSAMSLVLRQANGMGRTFDVALAYMIKDGGGYFGAVSGGGKKNVVTSAEDIKPLANELSLQLLGRVIDPQKMQKLIKFVQQEEVGYQNAAGSMVEQTPSVQNIVTKQLMETNPEEAQMQGTASVAEMIKKALGG